MILFRQQRGAFDDSIKTTLAFTGMDDFKEWFILHLPNSTFFGMNYRPLLTIENYGYDEKVGAYIRVVSVSKCAIGFLWTIPV